MSARSAARLTFPEAASSGVMITQASSRQAAVHCEGGLLNGAPGHPAVVLAAVGLDLDDAVPVVRVGLLAVGGGPRLLLLEELVGVVGQVHADVERRGTRPWPRRTSAGLVWSTGAKARIVPALYQYRSRSAMFAPWSFPWS